MFYLRNIIIAVVLLLGVLINNCNNPSSSETKETRRNNMVKIMAAGKSFQMGQAGIAVPVHQVTFTHDFWIDTTEVTQGDYESLMGCNPSEFKGNPMYPVESVTWFDAILYCNARSKRDGLDTVYRYDRIHYNEKNSCDSLNLITIDYECKGYRLPTEAEWEYACRAGTTTPYYFESSQINSYAWNEYYTTYESHPVATKLPNAFGLYDMSGLSWEWCNDWYGFYSIEDQIDPTGSNNGTERIVRGGGVHFAENERLRSAHRTSCIPSKFYTGTGIRVVLIAQ